LEHVPWRPCRQRHSYLGVAIRHTISLPQNTYMTEEKYDAIIVGGGFGGVYQLIHLRDLGLKCKLIEAGSDFGGTWYWNTYPGARVDSDIPTYEFSHPELWKGWMWTEKFPGGKELRAYFAYVDDKLKLRKDCRFDSRVKQAHWDDQLHIWHVTSDGKDGVYKAAARHLIMCTVRLPLPWSPTINARLGIRIQDIYSKVEGSRNIPGSMEPHSTLAERRDRDKRKTSRSHRDGSEWSASDSRDWATRTRGRIPTNPEPCDTHGPISNQPTGSGPLQASIRLGG
jgi:hypothetical protein